MKGPLAAAYFLPAIVISCAAPAHEQHYETGMTSHLQRDGKTLSARFLPPPGAARIPAGEGSITTFFRSLPLKPHEAPALYYDGRVKENDGIYAAVLSSMPPGNADLQQCADAVMRLRAEWHWSLGQHHRIHFNFTSGFRADWDRWRAGSRIAVSGNKVSWVKNATPSDAHSNLIAYLNRVFSYAGTLSLSRELKPEQWADMQPGEELIVGGSPGHAGPVMDMAADTAGHKWYMLSQSYMPAQEIQILCNPADPSGSPWYSLDGAGAVISTPQWDFSKAQLMRFDD